MLIFLTQRLRMQVFESTSQVDAPRRSSEHAPLSRSQAVRSQAQTTPMQLEDLILVRVDSSMPPDPTIMHKPGQSLSLDVGGHIYSTTFG